jgi:hypothetical protein
VSGGGGGWGSTRPPAGDTGPRGPDRRRLLDGWVVAEDEGLTVVVESGRAEEAGLSFSGRFARITLEVRGAEWVSGSR